MSTSARDARRFFPADRQPFFFLLSKKMRDALLAASGKQTGVLFLEFFTLAERLRGIYDDTQRQDYARNPRPYQEYTRYNESCSSAGLSGVTMASHVKMEQTPSCRRDVAKNFHWPELVRRAVPIFSFAEPRRHAASAPPRCASARSGTVKAACSATRTRPKGRTDFWRAC